MLMQIASKMMARTASIIINVDIDIDQNDTNNSRLISLFIFVAQQRPYILTSLIN